MAATPLQLARFCYIIASTSEKTLGAKRDALVRYATGIALTLQSIKQSPIKAFAIPFLQLDLSIAERADASN